MITKFDTFLNEVRYVNTHYPAIMTEPPLKDDETIRVYHGFDNFDDVEKILTNGLSGKQRAKRIYSYESGNNPYGLFVSVKVEVVVRHFAHSGVIIEFSSKLSDLEAPIWVGGRSYFCPGEYTKSFKDLDEREQQRLINRGKSLEHELEPIKKSDRPELAETIFENPERQALYIGNLNPNMIKYVWYNEILHKDRRTDGEWIRYSRKQFINKLKISTKRSEYDFFLPNDDFNMNKIIDMYKGDTKNTDFKRFVQFYLMKADDYRLKELDFFPKQIQQIKKLRDEGFFDKYL
jgi:hypothetical protein